MRCRCAIAIESSTRRPRNGEGEKGIHEEPEDEVRGGDHPGGCRCPRKRGGAWLRPLEGKAPPGRSARACRGGRFSADEFPYNAGSIPGGTEAGQEGGPLRQRSRPRGRRALRRFVVGPT